MFWEVITEMSNEDRQLLLKFMTGRTRLQPGVQQTIEFESKHEDSDKRLPIGHTCGQYLDLPQYSTSAIMKKQLLIAIRLCGEIDDDGSMIDSDDDSEGGPQARVRPRLHISQAFRTGQVETSLYKSP